MLSFLGQFSNSFFLAIALWPFAALALTLPILLVQYIHFHRLPRGRVVAMYLLILYLLALVAFTLYPLPDNPVEFCADYNLSPQLNPLQLFTDISEDGLRAILQIAMNVVFFVPLGVFLRNVFGRKVWGTLAIALAVSLFIETAQLTGAFGIYPCSYRLFDVDDLIFNTLGALIGFWVAFLLPNLSNPAKRRNINTQPGLVHRFVTFVPDVIMSSVVAVVILLPFYYIGGRDGIWRELQYPVHLVCFFLLQFAVPLFWNGQTVTAKLTGVSLDDRERTPFWRYCFYLVRVLLLTAAVMPHLGGFVLPAPVLPLVYALTVVWFLVTHKMPYSVVDRLFARRANPKHPKKRQ
jgi:glycopeptide antibiotics resistance protein